MGPPRTSRVSGESGGIERFNDANISSCASIAERDCPVAVRFFVRYLFSEKNVIFFISRSYRAAYFFISAVRCCPLFGIPQVNALPLHRISKTMATERGNLNYKFINLLITQENGFYRTNQTHRRN